MHTWRRTVSSMTQSEIQLAVVDSDWQAFRRSLKGMATEDKLNVLSIYLERCTEPNGYIDRYEEVRVDNYINALLRGGQLVRRSGVIEVQR
ncbi:MAG: hypothetical protein ACXABY_29015 [Candidatus Thorarchaeota archaeon]|jgi:hypothetical protein